MKVICKINNIFEIVNDQDLKRVKQYIQLSDGQLNLDKGCEYCVYGIVFRDNAPWYYICLDEEDECPTAYPADLFSISDDRLSSYWKLSVEKSKSTVFSSLVFDEWANDSIFYENLIDEVPKVLEVFRKYRTLIEEEYD